MSCRVTGSHLRQEVLAVQPEKLYYQAMQVGWDCLQDVIKGLLCLQGAGPVGCKTLEHGVLGYRDSADGVQQQQLARW